MQRKGLKRRPFLCTPSWLETQDLCRTRQGILINEVGPNVSIEVGPNQVVKRSELTRRSFSQRSVRTTLIVFPSPAFDDLPCLRQGGEPVYIQTLGPQRAVERLHVRVIRGLPRPREVDAHLVVIGPQIHDLTGELRSVIAEQELGNPALLPNAIQRRHYVFALQFLAHRDRQTFPSKYIHDRQRSKPSSIRELVGHEIQTPHFVGRSWPEALAPMQCSPTLSLRLVAQGQAFFLVQAIDQLFPHIPAFPP